MLSRATEDARLHRALGFDFPLITQQGFYSSRAARRTPHAARRVVV
jgi:hypothetical protein